MTARKPVSAKGIFEGIDIPEAYRGEYILVSDGKVIAHSKHPQPLLRRSMKMREAPLLLHVPEDDEAIAAF